MTVEYKSYLTQLSEAGKQRSAPFADTKSPVESLLDQLEAHEESERELLSDYPYAARFGSDPGVGFLMNLILEDEERHHRLMETMARDVRSSLLWDAAGSPLPSIAAGTEASAELLAQTEQFLQVENDSTGHLRELKKAVTKLNSGLLELMVDGMERDTQKHIGILKFIRKELEARR